MKNVVFLLLCNILLCNCAEPGEESWDYNDQRAWCKISDSCCGKYQSPIELWESDRKTQMTPFKFINYSVLPKTVTMDNNGHSISLTFTGIKPQISGGGLRSTYNLAALHFHWGVDNYQGSEHKLNNRQAPMELHFVHYNSKYANLSQAIVSKDSDALAVLGVLYWIDRSSNPPLDLIAPSLQYVKYKGQKTEVKPFYFRELLPKSTKYFFRYWGSLTTPTCDEVVVWTVFREPGFITNPQIKEFRTTFSTAKGVTPTKTIADNYRYIQALNRRVVYNAVEANDYYDYGDYYHNHYY